MKRIRRSGAARILSWILTVALITPLFTGFLAGRAANAQTPAVPGAVQTVIVLDFTNKAGPEGAALTRVATDQVAVELANSARFEVLRRDEVQRQANELGLHPPYDQVAKQRLASALGATQFVDGVVEFVRNNTRNTPHTVDVGLSVRVSEASSGDLLSGAAQIGSARSRPGVTDFQSLAQEAATNAAIQSVHQILTYNLPEGTVVSTVGQYPSLQVLVNRGSRDGVEPGMEMIVTRDNQRVAKIKISNVFPTDSEATVTDIGLGIRPEDRVRAVFPMPTFTAHKEISQQRTRPSAHNSISALGKILLVALAGIVIAVAAKGGNSSVTGVVAEPEVAAGASATPGVRVRWRENFFGSGTSQEFHVWRLPDVPFGFTTPFVPVFAVSGGQTQYDDLLTTVRPGFAFLQPGFPANNVNNGNGNNGSNNTTVSVTAAVAGPTPGQSYVYQVSAVIAQQPIVTSVNQNGGGGGNGSNNLIFLETNPVNSGQATPLNPPVVQTPTSSQANVPITSFQISWSSVAGADLYQVEVSTDRSFKNPNLIFRQQVFSTAPFSSGVLQSVTLNLTTQPALRNDPNFANFVNGKTQTPPLMFVRVGARNSGDRPGPVNWLSGNHSDPDQRFRFIYSVPVTPFTPAVVPPPPPGG